MSRLPSANDDETKGCTDKVVRVGDGGGVGSRLANNLLLGPVSHDVVLDPRAGTVASHGVDFERGRQAWASRG
jgi:hypothetical protein